jgi:hypothetical protein
MGSAHLTSSALTTQILLGILLSVASQSTVVRAQEQGPIKTSAFVDTTIAHDYNDLPSRYRPYTTQPYYNNEGALNLGFVDATLSTERYHGRLALQYGSSVIANYDSEPDEFVRYFQEAYGGVSLSDTWSVNAGIYFSHIGMESWISRDDYTIGRSLMADYSPYYQSGVYSAHDISDRLHVELHVIRGWQNISENRPPCFGTQVTYELTSNTQVAHNTFIGDEDGLRVFNDIFIKYSFTEALGVIAAFDLGAQNRSGESRAW